MYNFLFWPAHGGRGEAADPTRSKFKNTNDVVIIRSKVLYDLWFSLQQSMKSAYD
jgi:hypothetical protein